MIPQVYFDKVKQFFNGDTAKTWAWFQAINPSLGGVTPLSMIKAGRIEKLKHFIDNALDENKRWYP
jgi:hypothetical protein